MPKQERAERSICVFGNGDCPGECPNYETGKEMFEAIPEGFDVNQFQEGLRARTMAGDGVDREYTVTEVAGMLIDCVNEDLPSQVTPSAEALELEFSATAGRHIDSSTASKLPQRKAR